MLLLGLPARAAEVPFVLVSAEEGLGPTQYRYNAQGQLVKKIQGIATYEYDSHGRPVHLCIPAPERSPETEMAKSPTA